jgi:DNA-directed RNA polymerase subunit beta
MNQKEQQTLNKILQMTNDARGNVLLNTTVSDTVKQILNSIEDDDIKLKVNKIFINEKFDNKDIESQMTVRNKNQIWANDLRADLEIIDKKTDKSIDKVQNLKITTIPKITDRGTYLINGNEYVFTKQSRLKPGVYTKRQSNGEISSFFNVDKTIDFDRGFNNNFKLNFEPETKIFTMGYGNKNIPLINALKVIGVSTGELVKKWGQQVYDANSNAYDKHELRDQNKLYEAVFGISPANNINNEDIRNQIKERLFATNLDPETTKITLGKSYTNVNKDVILDASQKIIDINKGVVESDDRESLVFKSFFDVEDHIRERLVKNSNKIINNIKYKLKKNKFINKSISSQSFDPFVVGTITTSQLSTPPEQTNIMSIIGGSSKFTVMGEGGIGSTNAITNDIRKISNSEVGFVDPLHTPEGQAIGVAVHTSVDTIKVGNNLYSKMLKKDGEKVLLSPQDVWDKNVAFPDEYDITKKVPVPKNNKIKVVNQGKIKSVNSSDVDVIIANPIGMFDSSVNMIPFLNSIQGNRGLTASKMQEQALPLKYRDKPLFNIVDEKGRNFGKNIASIIALPKSPVDGIVEDVNENKIIIKDKNKNKYTIQLYNNFSLNGESFLHNESRVKIGDSVKQDDVLADNNFTKDGNIAIGTNLKVAYVPYKGYNFEDSAIISESAAKKLTSEHMYDFKTKRTSNGVFSRDKFKAYYPEVLPSNKSKKLDSDGVVKVGETVERDDVVIAHLERKSPTSDDIILGRLDKQLKRDMSNNALLWDKDVIGVVKKVTKSGNNVVVNIKTEEPLKVADKISGLHGNKHIISKIVPDDEMPYNLKTGEKIDLTMSPLGVSNRINTSQLLEAAVGKLVSKTGKTYDINNFSGEDNSRKIIGELKKEGLSDKDILVDPETKKPLLNPIATGTAHILKLEHIVDHKFSARYKDSYDANEQAATGGITGGKNLGRMEMAALLARGANENLREMFQIKGQKNDEYWRAMETGQSLPPPKRSFAWDKMLAMMSGAGINVEQKGKTFALKPMTDKDIIEMSSGEITKPELSYRKKDLSPIKDGLFDPVKAGGLYGNNFTHFKLPEPTLNPITTSATANLLDMPITHLDSILTGKKMIDRTSGKIVDPGSPNSISGGPAIKLLLERINVKKELKNAEEDSKTITNPTELNKIHKKIRYLKSIKDNNMKPSDYIISNVLVTPSKFRPVFQIGTEGTVVVSDINDLYQQTAYTSSALKNLKTTLDESIDNEDIKNLQLAEARGALYNDLKAVVGMGDPTSYLHKVKNKKGFIPQIDGGATKQTKEGFFQDKVLERRQDLVGRSTIILNPELGGDELGIPKIMAGKIFQPFIMKKMVEWGYKPVEAQKLIKDNDPIYQRALQVVSDERLVIANRAPTLHRWNMTAFKPKLTDGKSIEVPGITVVENMGGDFDGDSIFCGLYISLKINDLCEQFDKIDFGSLFFEKDLDINCKNIYINSSKQMYSLLKSLEINMPCLNDLPVLMGDKSIIHINIENFPRIKDSCEIQNNGNELYKVPDGISIFTIDSKTHKFLEVPVTQFSVHKNLTNYIVKLSDKNELILSSDQSAIALNMVTFELEKISPRDLFKKAIPKLRKLDIIPSLFKIPLIDYSKSDINLITGKDTIKCIDEIELTREVGHFIGIMIGNGWISNDVDICMATVHPEIKKIFNDTINKMMKEDIGIYSIDAPHSFMGYDCFSTKHTKTSVSLAKNIKTWIGHLAKNKHLPIFFMSTSEEFRLGLLSGLIDTDGTSTWNHSQDKKSQYILLYSTTSIRLAEEIVTLSRTLGISASITSSKRDTCVEYTVVFSTQTIVDKKLNFINPDKKEAFEKFQATGGETSASMAARLDMVPFSDDMYIKFRLHIKSNKYPNLYSSMYDAVNSGCISRSTAIKIINILPKGIADTRWIEIVNNKDITWVYAKNIELNKELLTMYDITAPGSYTFMLNNGIICQDTFQLHVPISSKALQEAELMKPSASMLKTGYDTVLNKPSLDITAGSWLVSKGKGGKETNLSFNNIDDARESFKNNKFTYGDNVTINNIKAPFGMHEINSIVPDDMKKYDIELTSKNTEGWIRDVVKKYNGKQALALADKIKDVGNNYVTTYGLTLGVSDTIIDKKFKDKLVSDAWKNVDKKDDTSVVKSFNEAVSKGIKKLESDYNENTMVGIGLKSGAGKGISNFASIALMPGIVTDIDGKPVPVPITKSYSEGLNTSQYWAAAHGARSGNIQKSVQSFKPGWLTKDLTNSIYETRINNEDPIDTTGFEFNIDDKKSIINRYLAKDVKDSHGKILAKRNDIVDSDLVNKLNSHKVKNIFVQSPITDPTPGDGFSSYSYGADYNGKRHNIGDNIGIISAHTITEPSLKLAMKAFHTGGTVAAGKTGSAFDVLERVLRFTTNIPNKSTLASMNGLVKNIVKSPIGGWDVVLQNDKKEDVHYIDPNTELLVKKGDKVFMGDNISTGTTSVHDVLKYRGFKDAQKFLVKEISNINEGKLDSRDIETIVRGITNTTRILHPGSSPYAPYDVAPLTTVEYYNNNNNKEDDIENTEGDHLAQNYGIYKKNYKITDNIIENLSKKGVKRVNVFKDRIKHEPFLTPAGISAKAQTSEDWISRLAHNRIAKVLEEGTTQGFKSVIDPNIGNPITQLITGEYRKNK